MCSGDMAVLVLDQVQELDQQIASALGAAQQSPDLGLRGRISLPALGHGPSLAPARARMAQLLCGGMYFGHRDSNFYSSMICRAHCPDNKGVALNDRENLSNVGYRGQYSYEYP